MRHARTTKGSQLNLDEVDEILSSFFKTATGRKRERLLTESDHTPAAQTAGDPRSHTDDRDRHRKAMPGPRGKSDASDGAGAAPQEEEGQDRQKAAAADEAAPTRDSPSPGGASHRPPRGNARPRKKIRFTGELGAFLDGEGMWSEIALMEAERKAEVNILPQLDDRIRHPEQKEDGHERRVEEEEEGRKPEETQEKQAEGEEEGAGVVGQEGWRGGIRPEGEGKGDDGWQAAAAGNNSSGKSPHEIVAADPRGSPVSSDPTSTSAGDESPLSLPPPNSAAAAAAAAAAAVIGGGSAAGEGN